MRSASIAACAFMCALADLHATGALGAEPLSYRLAFEPRPGVPFTLQFARRDSRNHYKLTHHPEENMLELSKTVHGRTASLGTRDRLPGFSVVGVWLRPREVRVELDGRTVLACDDTAFRCDAFALEPAGVARGPVRANPAGGIAFEEDFENRQVVRERWHTPLGSWEIHAPTDELSQRNGGPPMFSAYRATGTGMCLALAGEPYWADLRLRALVRIENGERAGVAFNVFDERNFSAFVITPGKDGGGKAQLLDFCNGEPQELYVFQPLRAEREQWYGLNVETYANQAWCGMLGLAGDRWQILIGGVPLSPATGTGCIGLVSWGGALFDDVSVASFQSFVDTLEVPRPSCWKLAGQWEHRNNTLAGSGQARLVRWPRGAGRVDVELIPREGATGAILTHSPSEKSYYAFGLFGREWQFRRVVNSEPSVLARAPVQDARRYRLALASRLGRFRCLVEDRLVFEVCDLALPDLGGGLTALSAAFGCFRVSEETERGGVELFATDFSKAKGSDKVRAREDFTLPDILQPSGPAWRFEKRGGRTALASDRPGTALFHCALHCDVSVAATVSQTGCPAVVLSSGAGGGYKLALDEHGANVILYRNDRVIALRPILAAKQRVALELAKYGATMLAFADSLPMLAYSDPAPLGGCRPGLAAGGAATFYRFSIRAENASAYSFETFRPEWQESGGGWILHAGRTDADPARWITGIADGDGAWLWERRERWGGFAWYVTVAPAVEGYADGGSRTFPIENVHLRFCARPEDPAAGYALVLRPDGKQSLLLLKGDRELAEKEYSFPKGRPVRVRIARYGDRIEAHVDGEQLLELDGVPPSGGGHLSLGVEGSRARFLDVLVLPID